MLPTSPLSIGATLDAGIELYGKAFRAIVPIALLASIPLVLVSTGYSVILGGAMGVEANPEEISAGTTTSIIAFAVLLYPALTFNIHSVLHGLTRQSRDEKATIGGALKRGIVLCAPYVLLLILYLIVLAIGLVLFVIPGMILMLSMSLMFTVPHVEGRSVWGSLWRSHQLVWGGNWFRTAAVTTVSTVIVFIVSILVSLVGLLPELLAVDDPYGPLTLTTSALSQLFLYAFVTPLFYAVIIVLHNDLVLRKEGADLQVQLASLPQVSPT